MIRAVIFDLDDTLYPERRFALSGFAAVAREVERRYSIPADDVFRVLKDTLVTRLRHIALQMIGEAFDLPPVSVLELRDVFRAHVPNLKLPRESRSVLRELRPSWRIGILTNGIARVQANKIAALGLAPEVDAIVLAEETGTNKPRPGAFHAVLGRLGVDAAEAIFVGDDPWCDMFGARRVGLKTIRVRRGAHAGATGPFANDADRTVFRIGEVPSCVRSLFAADLSQEAEPHAA